jgi:GNAT superfamily N-acetyltransferase
VKVHEFAAGTAGADQERDGLLPPFDPELPRRQGADLHGIVTKEGTAAARASIWFRDVPALDGEGLGVVGHFDAAHPAAARRVLDWAAERLAGQGCTLMVGPMDGNTWRRYRFVTERGHASPFFLEPDHPAAYPDYFTDAGFTPLAHYTSAVVEAIPKEDPRIAPAIVRLKANGIRWRSLDQGRFEEELRAIHRLSCVSFAHNFLYTPLAEEEFLAQYRIIGDRLVPELVLMAERDGELVGYLFAIPDHRPAGQPTDTCIVKTVAVAPGRACAGLGSVLIAESHRIAAAMGYRRAIHALMHEGNSSRNFSGPHASTLRRYTLFQRRLATS